MAAAAVRGHSPADACIIAETCRPAAGNPDLLGPRIHNVEPALCRHSRPDNPALQARITDTAAKRAKGQPTVPSTLATELATNPYLRAHLPALKAAVGLPKANDATVFAEIRARKDKF